MIGFFVMLYVVIGMIVSHAVLLFDLLEVDGSPSEIKKMYQKYGIFQPIMIALVTTFAFPAFLLYVFYFKGK